MRNIFATLALTLVVLGSATASAQVYSVEQVPNPRDQNGWVADQAGILSDADEAELNAAISGIHSEQGIEIAVVTVPNVAAATPKDFATELFNYWGIGDRQSNNGLLVLMVVGQRRLEMETGYGTEAVLTDGWLKSMQEKVMIPEFKDGDFGAGVKRGVDECITRLRQYPDGIPVGIASNTFEDNSPPEVPWWLMVLAPLLGVGGAGAWWKHRRDRTCPMCKTKMQMIPEDEDDEKLGEGQRLEERLGSVDYQFWYCIDDDFHRLLKVNKWFSGFANCRKCNFRTMSVSTRTVRSPTYTSTGLEEITEDCRHCSHHSVRHRTLPKRTPPSSSSSSSSYSSSSGGSSFGGGSSGGGGAGSSW